VTGLCQDTGRVVFPICTIIKAEQNVYNVYIHTHTYTYTHTYIYKMGFLKDKTFFKKLHQSKSAGVGSENICEVLEKQTQFIKIELQHLRNGLKKAELSGNDTLPENVIDGTITGLFDQRCNYLHQQILSCLI